MIPTSVPASTTGRCLLRRPRQDPLGAPQSLTGADRRGRSHDVSDLHRCLLGPHGLALLADGAARVPAAHRLLFVHVCPANRFSLRRSRSRRRRWSALTPTLTCCSIGSEIRAACCAARRRTARTTSTGSARSSPSG